MTAGWRQKCFDSGSRREKESRGVSVRLVTPESAETGSVRLITVQQQVAGLSRQYDLSLHTETTFNYSIPILRPREGEFKHGT